MCMSLDTYCSITFDDWSTKFLRKRSSLEFNNCNTEFIYIIFIYYRLEYEVKICMFIVFIGYKLSQC